MPEIRPDIETFAKIKVIGVGGSGGSAVNRMIQSRIRGVDFIAANTDVQALHNNQASIKLHIGKDITKGLGAGMNPELGKRAAEESQNEVREVLSGSDMVFITCGLGGGTGTGAAPVIAEIAKDSGALTIAVVTKPFDFEGMKRREIADLGYNELSSKVDAIITIPNERLLQIVDKGTPLLEAFKIADDVLRHGVQGISEIITMPGLINVDFADVKSIMEGTGSALMGIGQASGENRAIEAAKLAVDSPLLDVTIDGARGILFTISGGKDLGMQEINDAARVISEHADSDAKIIFGTSIDENIEDQVKITVIATGFEDDNSRYYRNNAVVNNYSNVPKQNTEPQKPREEKPVFRQKQEESSSEPQQASTKLKNIFSRKIEKDQDVSSNKISVDNDILQDTPNNEAEDLDIPAFIRKKMG